MAWDGRISVMACNGCIPMAWSWDLWQKMLFQCHTPFHWIQADWCSWFHKNSCFEPGTVVWLPFSWENLLRLFLPRERRRSSTRVTKRSHLRHHLQCLRSPDRFISCRWGNWRHWRNLWASNMETLPLAKNIVMKQKLKKIRSCLSLWIDFRVFLTSPPTSSLFGHRILQFQTWNPPSKQAFVWFP